MSDFFQKIENLSPEKQEQLLRMLQAKEESVAHISMYRLARDTNAFPASFAQQRLWFLDQLQPETPYYNICRAFLLSGPLRIDLLEQSLNAIVCRHEALRTIFAMQNGQLMQIITPIGPSHLAIEQFYGAEHEDIIQRITREALTPFDLQHGPLLRATLLEYGTGEHLFILTMHHIISDGWSMQVFFREFSQFYQAYTAGQSSLPGELLIQYVDYTHWQREWLQGARLETQRVYWEHQLRG